MNLLTFMLRSFKAEINYNVNSFCPEFNKNVDACYQDLLSPLSYKPNLEVMKITTDNISGSSRKYLPESTGRYIFRLLFKNNRLERPKHKQHKVTLLAKYWLLLL